MSTQTPRFHIQASASAAGGSVSWQRMLARLVRVHRRWMRKAMTRRQLRRLPPHLYRDIGRTPAQVQREAQRYFWQ